ncbi:MAG: exopolysaccharide biosynthesis-like protein [Clostridiales bacterium]|jgi:hypothetical protein|nr:exopolysaccharide biosynthesis-like protein [Clostridiales bacterium]
MKKILVNYNMKFIAICLAISLVVGSLFCFISIFNGRETVATLQLTFDGLESGNNPDGSRFRKNQIKDTTILETVIDKLELDITAEELNRQVYVTPIIPEEMAAQLKATTQASFTPIYEYVPNEFNISINEPDISGISKKDAKRILEAIVSEYTNSFTTKFGNGNIGSLVTLDKKISEYDYLDAIKVVESRLDLLTSAADNMASRVGYYRGSDDNMSFEDIANKAENLSSVDLVGVSSLINIYNISKEKEKLLSIFEYKIKMYDYEVRKNTNLSDVAVDMISVVSADTNTDANAITEVLKSQTFMNSLLSSAAKNSYYSFVVQKAVEANVAAELANTQKKYYQAEVAKIKGSTIDASQVDWATKQVELQIASIEEKMNNLYASYNKLSNEYLTSQVDNTINLVGAIGLIGVSKLKLLVFMGGFGFIGLVGGIVFGKKKIK